MAQNEKSYITIEMSGKAGIGKSYLSELLCNLLTDFEYNALVVDMKTSTQIGIDKKAEQMKRENPGKRVVMIID